MDGITFSGGDPRAREKCGWGHSACRRDPAEISGQDHLAYTGYLWEEISGLRIVRSLDVLVDGPFDLETRDVTLKWKGSPNQRVIDVPRTLKKGSVVLYA